MNTPQIGQYIKVYGVLCRIVKVYPLGTLDALNESTGQAFRVTGLMFL